MKFMGLKALEASSLWPKSIFYFYWIFNKGNLSRPRNRRQRLKLTIVLMLQRQKEGLFSPSLRILPKNNAFEIFVYVPMLPCPPGKTVRF